MSLNAMHRNIMIYSDTEEKAINKLESIVSELDEEILINRPGFVQTPTKKLKQESLVIIVEDTDTQGFMWTFL